MTTTTLDTPSSTLPNFSAAGRRRRERTGSIAVGLSVVAGVTTVLSRQPGWVRALAVGVPLMGGVASLLQARRNTCVVRALQGTFEHDDNSTTRMNEHDVRESRRVARSIVRDAALAGVAGGVLVAMLP